MLGFLDIFLQHLQPLLPHPAECTSRIGVIVIVMGVLDLFDSFWFFSLALTRVLPSVFVFFRLRHGLGICSSSSGLGFSICRSSFISRSGVYSVTRKVSNKQGSLFFCSSTFDLSEYSTWSCILLMR